LEAHNFAEIIERDVVVIGSGAGGLTAALTAAVHGASTLVVEKAATIGGTTAYSEAMIWVPGSRQAKEAGVVDSDEDALEYIAAVARGKFDRKRMQAYIKSAATMLAFVEDNSLLKFTLASKSMDYYPACPGATKGARSLSPGKFDGKRLGQNFKLIRPPLNSMRILGGMSISGLDLPHFYNVGRSLKSTLVVFKLVTEYVLDRLKGWPRNTLIGNGEGVIAALYHGLVTHGGAVMTNTKAQRLVCDHSGRASAIHVVRNQKVVIVRARKAIILATGGFSANAEMRQHYYPKEIKSTQYVQLVCEGATGDGIAMAEAVGAAISCEVDQPAAWAPTSYLEHKKAGFPHFLERAKPGVIIVGLDGKRFANEAMIYHDLVPAMLKQAGVHGKGPGCWIIADHKAMRRYGLGAAPPWPAPISPSINAGYLVKAKSLKDLAHRIGVDHLMLSHTVNQFNEAARNGVDPEFGRGVSLLDLAYGDPNHQPNPCLGPLDQAPFYAVRIGAGDLGSFVGLHTNSDAVVIDKRGMPIDGLYAVGLDAATAMGGRYPAAGVTVGAAMTTGWIAATHALD
jgi:succinate dehydrogenase/fumarate reductase flavoprotein subunit